MTGLVGRGVNTRTVSYTHLDVYKRQIRGSLAAIAEVTQELGIRACLCYEVSDVYKRQVYISGDGVTVAVPAPAEGLSEAAVARITEAVTTGTAVSYTHLDVYKRQFWGRF